MVRAARLRSPGGTPIIPADMCWDDEEPLYPGDHAEVTITVTDDEAPEFLAGGQRFTLWSGRDVGPGLSPGGYSPSTAPTDPGQGGRRS